MPKQWTSSPWPYLSLECSQKQIELSIFHATKQSCLALVLSSYVLSVSLSSIYIFYTFKHIPYFHPFPTIAQQKGWRKLPRNGAHGVHCHPRFSAVSVVSRSLSPLSWFPSLLQLGMMFVLKARLGKLTLHAWPKEMLQNQLSAASNTPLGLSLSLSAWCKI